MSLTSLRGAAGFASSAFDTARSTFKGLAEAAVQSEAVAPAEAAAAPKPDPAAEQPAPRKGVRRGTLLDAYA